MQNDPLSPPERELTSFCQRWKINRLELFGSTVRGNFTPSSDIDLLVEFDASYQRTLTDQIQMHAEIEALFQRPVDLIVKNTIQNSPNPYKRESILSQTVAIYVKG
jgi:predicted nucleotidyltransferase